MEVSFFAPSYINCLGNKIYVVLLERVHFVHNMSLIKIPVGINRTKRYYRNCDMIGEFACCKEK